MRRTDNTTKQHIDLVNLDLYQKSIERFFKFLNKYERKYDWARATLGSIGMFDSMFGVGDEPIFDSILNLSPICDVEVDAEGMTPLDKYLSTSGSLMPADERKFLSRLNMGAMGWYEVEERKRDLLTVQDVTTGERFTFNMLDFFEGVPPPKKGEVLWCRIFGENGTGTLLTTPYCFHSDMKKNAQNIDRTACIIHFGTDDELKEKIIPARKRSVQDMCRYVQGREMPHKCKVFSLPPWIHNEYCSSREWGALMNIILRWAFKAPFFRSVWQHLHYTFFGIDGNTDFPNELLFMLYHFLFGYEIETLEGATIADLFLESDYFKRSISPKERRMLKELIEDNLFSAFRIEKVYKGKGVLLKSIDGEEFDVVEKSGSQNVKKGGVFIGRLFKSEGEKYVFGGPVEYYPDDAIFKDKMAIELGFFDDELSWLTPRIGEYSDNSAIDERDAFELMMNALACSCSDKVKPDEILDHLMNSENEDAFLNEIELVWSGELELHRFMKVLSVAWSVLKCAEDEVKSDERHTTKVGRNDPCPCGSGKKYKKCCLEMLH